MSINPPCVARQKRNVFRSPAFAKRRARISLRFMRAAAAGLTTFILSAPTFAAGQSSLNFVMQRNVGRRRRQRFKLHFGHDGIQIAERHGERAMDRRAKWFAIKRRYAEQSKRHLKNPLPAQHRQDCQSE